jgi:hypothetical protein
MRKWLRTKALAMIPAVAALIALPSAASASYSSGGQVTFILTTNAGIILFDVSGPRTTRPACATQMRWAFNGSTAAGQAKLASLLTAYARQASITVYGTATCVSWGDTEEVDYFIINQ